MTIYVDGKEVKVPKKGERDESDYYCPLCEMHMPAYLKELHYRAVHHTSPPRQRGDLCLPK